MKSTSDKTPKRNNFVLSTRWLSSEASRSPFQHLRSAIDWQEWCYDIPVKKNVFWALSLGGECTIAGTRHLWDARHTPSGLVLQTEGVYIRLVDPDRLEKDEETGLPKKVNHDVPNQYPIVVQLQGKAFSGGVDMFQAAEDLERILGLPFDIKRVPGRIDLACDIWIRDSSERGFSSKDLYETITCSGDHYKLKDNWATKTRRIEMRGSTMSKREFRRFKHKKVTDYDFEDRSVSSRNNLTLYLGNAKMLQLAVYEKSADFTGNTKHLVLDEWKEKGYNPEEGLVARFEYTISRQTIRKSIFEIDGEEVDGADISLEQLYLCLPQIWQTCINRIRYCPNTYKKRKTGEYIEVRKRNTAPFWDILKENPPEIDKKWDGAFLRYKKRTYNVNRLFVDTMHYLINLSEAAGIDALDLVKLSALEDNDENREYKKRSAWTGYKKRQDPEYYENDGRTKPRIELDLKQYTKNRRKGKRARKDLELQYTG